MKPIILTGGEYCAWVDDVDFEWASQWKWKAIKDRTGKKVYAYRTTRLTGSRKNVKYWLHKEICTRANGLPPSEDHRIADHKDGNSLMDTRENLRWATRSENRKNRNGIYDQQLRMAFKTGDMSRVITRAA